MHGDVRGCVSHLQLDIDKTYMASHEILVCACARSLGRKVFAKNGLESENRYQGAEIHN